jgi:riboflavin kinase/FMN adenylyltransferase
MIIIGKVLEGQRKAEGIGFPTANILNTENVSSGIYAGRVNLEGEKFNAVIYIGEKRKDILEAHLFDFDGDLYGKEIEIEVIHKLRDDGEINDFEILKKTIKKDVEDAKIFLSTN